MAGGRGAYQAAVDSPAGPVAEVLYGNPAKEAHARQMRETAIAYQNLREPTADARTQALQAMLGGLGGPLNQRMGELYGASAMMDFGQAGQNPITPELLAAGNVTPPEPEEGGILGGDIEDWYKMLDPVGGEIADWIVHAGAGIF